jgi:hypothetical protein
MNAVRLLAAGVDPAVLARLAPPACAGVGPLPAWESDGGGRLRLAVPLDAAFLSGADRLVPSLSNTSAGDHAFRFGLRVRVGGGALTPWVRLTRIGRPPGGELEPTTAERAGPGAPLGAEVDTFRLFRPAEGGELEVCVWSTDPAEFRRAPCLLALSAAGAPASAPPPTDLADAPALPVPALSQLAEAESIRMRICSPVSVAMVLGSLGAHAGSAEVAAAAYCAEHDRYGVWPANIWAASRWGVLGAAVALSTWECAGALLARGIPLVISEAHGPGALPGSPLPETDGHLLVLRGWRAGRALVNDPAAPTVESVPREYDLADLSRAWLGHGGIAYVFAHPNGGPE